MRRIKVNGHVLEVFEGIDELPIINFQKYNKYLLIDAGVGSDVDSIGQHIVSLAKLIGADDKEKALAELENLQNNLIMINSEISPTNLAFIALVHSIDGEKLTDLSDTGLKMQLEKIKGVRQSALMELLSGLKKNYSDELESYFPGLFGADSRQKEAFDRMVSRLKFLYDTIIDPENETMYEEKIKEIDTEELKKYKPKRFVGKTSIEIKYDKQFESSCALISQKVGLDAKSMTVRQYYTTLEVIKKQADAEQKAYNKYKR